MGRVQVYVSKLNLTTAEGKDFFTFFGVPEKIPHPQR